MEIETDYSEVKLRGQSVGYRTCIICGKTFAKDMQHPKRQKCPECFSIRDGNIALTAALFREMKRTEENDEKKRRERQRRRDAEYARWERENGVRPRFEINGNVVTEIRGTSCIGCHAVSSVKHS